MKAARRKVQKSETEWLRAYAEAYEPTETGFAFPAERLREISASLVDIRVALRRCEVIYADKLDGPGALWIAEGPIDEQDRLRLSLIVVSETLDVRLREIERFRVEVNLGEDGPNDAA